MNKFATIMKWAATVLAVVTAVEQNAPTGTGNQKLALALGILTPAVDEVSHVTDLIGSTVAALNTAGLFKHADAPTDQPQPTAPLPLGRAVTAAKMALQRRQDAGDVPAGEVAASAS